MSIGKKNQAEAWWMVREKGLEPLHRKRKNLNLVRLPISPLPQSGDN